MAGAGVSQAMLAELSAKERKALFVRIGFQGETSSVRQVPRFRLNAMNVNRVFNCDVEFLQEDATGNIIWPKNWATDCLPPPYLYFIREKVWPELDPDAMELRSYRGKTLVVVDNVPEEVTEGVLVAWLNAGLDDDDPDLASAKIELAETQENLDKVEKQIRELPSMKVQGSNAKEELETKKKRAQALNMQKIDLEEDIRALKEKFSKLQRDREAMIDSAFQVRMVETKMPMRLNVWEVRFSRDKKGQRMAYIAVHKYNWSEFRVAYHRYTGAIITGKNDLVGSTGEFQEINMRNVTLSRRKHGVGMYKFADERGFYSGNFRHGLRHGMGTEINQQGRYQGHFVRDWRSGPGSQVLANGDVYRGPYGGHRHHEKESLIFGDEYCDGVPHGKGRIRFVDGSVYDGEWKDGGPCGLGKYIAATGVVMEGTFGRWATLHGYGSYTIDEVTRIGVWRDGLLHGHGTEIDMQGGTYEGDWRNGEKHGYGTLATKLVGGKYEGWYHYGYRWGRGVMNYGNIDRDREAAEAKMKKIAEAMREKSLGRESVRNGGGGDGDGGEEGLTKAELQAMDGLTIVSAAGTLIPFDQAVMIRPGRGSSSSNTNSSSSSGPAAAGAGTVRGGAAGGGAAASSSSSTSFSHGGAKEESKGGSKSDDDDDDDDDEDDAEGNAEAGGDGFTRKTKKSQTEYERMQGESVKFIPYRGDCCYEGRWRAGNIRTNGVFTRRLGRPEPNLHTMAFAHNGRNPNLPLLSELAPTEEEVSQKRAQMAKATLKETIASRLIKEADNLSSFVYWKKLAEKNQKEIRRKTARGKKQLEQVKAAIKKPERAKGQVEEQEAYSDDSYESSDSSEGAADMDDQQYMV